MMDMDSPFSTKQPSIINSRTCAQQSKKIFPLSRVKLPPTVMVDSLSLILYGDIHSSLAHKTIHTEGTLHLQRNIRIHTVKVRLRMPLSLIHSHTKTERFSVKAPACSLIHAFAGKHIGLWVT